MPETPALPGIATGAIDDETFVGHYDVLGGNVRHRWLFLLFVALSVSADAQWLNFAPPGTPTTGDGKPDLTAPAPRTAEGKPDLSGTWMHELTSVAEMKRL